MDGWDPLIIAYKQRYIELQSDQDFNLKKKKNQKKEPNKESRKMEMDRGQPIAYTYIGSSKGRGLHQKLSQGAYLLEKEEANKQSFIKIRIELLTPLLLSI